jgi:gluconate 2-dehydrogenase gamma chain
VEQPTPSRRQFLAASGNLASAGWISLNWPQIAAAAGHAEQASKSAHDKTAPPASLNTLSMAEAAEVEAIANQIVPGGITPGARDARVIFFIDHALGSFFAAQLPAFRQGLVDFQNAHATRNGAEQRFSLAPPALQTAFLSEVEKTPFFIAVRRLTILGLLALPKYGGNHDKLGWKVIGFVDRHVWQPPFGYYDEGYAGFVPYPGTKPYTA